MAAPKKQKRMCLANRLYAQGQYAKLSRIIKLLSNYGDIDLLVYAASNGLAACLEAQGQLQQAAEKYRAYAQQNPQKMEARRRAAGGSSLLWTQRPNGYASTNS